MVPTGRLSNWEKVGASWVAQVHGTRLVLTDVSHGRGPFTPLYYQSVVELAE